MSMNHEGSGKQPAELALEMSKRFRPLAQPETQPSTIPIISPIAVAAEAQMKETTAQHTEQPSAHKKSPIQRLLSGIFGTRKRKKGYIA